MAGDTNQPVREIGHGCGLAVVQRDVGRGLAQPLPQAGVGEQPLDLAGNGLRVTGRDDERAFAVGQRVGRPRRRASSQSAACAAMASTSATPNPSYRLGAIMMSASR